MKATVRSTVSQTRRNVRAPTPDHTSSMQRVGPDIQAHNRHYVALALAYISAVMCGLFGGQVPAGLSRAAAAASTGSDRNPLHYDLGSPAPLRSGRSSMPICGAE